MKKDVLVRAFLDAKTVLNINKGYIQTDVPQCFKNVNQLSLWSVKMEHEKHGKVAT